MVPSCSAAMMAAAGLQGSVLGVAVQAFVGLPVVLFGAGAATPAPADCRGRAHVVGVGWRRSYAPTVSRRCWSAACGLPRPMTLRLLEGFVDGPAEYRHTPGPGPQVTLSSTTTPTGSPSTSPIPALDATPTPHTPAQRLRNISDRIGGLGRHPDHHQPNPGAGVHFTATSNAAAGGRY